MNNIDNSVPAVLAKAVEEFEEAAAACRVLQKTLCNITTSRRFQDLPDINQALVIERLTQALGDPFYTIQQLICTMDKHLGIKPEIYFAQTVQKLIERRYVEHGHKKRAL